MSQLCLQVELPFLQSLFSSKISEEEVATTSLPIGALAPLSPEGWHLTMDHLHPTCQACRPELR